MKKNNTEIRNSLECIHKPIRMYWKGLSETPSNRKKSLEGLYVGLFVRYRCSHSQAPEKV